MIGRRQLITGAAAVAAMASLPHPAHAAANGWDYPNSSLLGAYVPGSSATQLKRVAWWVGHAHDATAKLHWFWNPYTQSWSGSGSGSPDPAAGTGGIDTSSVEGTPMFPMWAGYTASAYEAATLVSATASLQGTVPSGFSSLATMAGGPVTWNPADKSANITLTNSDATAYHSASTSTWPSVRATSSITGKAYWETQHTSPNTPSNLFHMDGMGNASAPLTTYPGGSGNGFAWYLQTGAMFGGLTAAAQGAWPSFPTVKYFGAKTLVGKNTGKWFFEGRITSDTGSFGAAANTALGLVQASAVLTDDPGRVSGSLGYFGNAGLRRSNTDVGPAAMSFASGDYVLSIFDFGTGKAWFYVNGTYSNGSPLTPTGGTDISSLTGSLLYPAASIYQIEGATVDMNFSAGFNYSSVATALMASGYCPWDTTVCASGGSRGSIFGSANGCEFPA